MVELSQGNVNIVYLAGSQTGEGVVVVYQMGPLRGVEQSYWSRFVKILCSDWWNLIILPPWSMPITQNASMA